MFSYSPSTCTNGVPPRIKIQTSSSRNGCLQGSDSKLPLAGPTITMWVQFERSAGDASFSAYLGPSCTVDWFLAQKPFNAISRQVKVSGESSTDSGLGYFVHCLIQTYNASPCLISTEYTLSVSKRLLTDLGCYSRLSTLSDTGQQKSLSGVKISVKSFHSRTGILTDFLKY